MTSLPARQLQTANQLPARPFSDPSLASLRNALGWVQGKPTLMTGHTVTEAHRKRLLMWRTTLASRISCDANDNRDKAVELAKLTAAFPQQGQDQLSSDLRVETYFDALNGLPGWAVRQARLRIVNGETEYGRPWGPGPIEFADLVRQQVKPIRDDLQDVDTLLSAEPIDKPPTEAEKARVAAKIEGLKDEFRVKEKAWRTGTIEALKLRAGELGVDFETAFDSISDQPAKSGTFDKIRSA